MNRRKKKVICTILVCTILFLMCLAGAKIYSLHQLLYAHAHAPEGGVQRIMIREVVITEVDENEIYFIDIDSLEDFRLHDEYMARDINRTFHKESTIIRDRWGRKKDWTDLEPGQRARMCVTSDVTHVGEQKKPYYWEMLVTHYHCYEILIW